jgi:hypothetical protein
VERPFGLRGLRVMSYDDVIGQQPQSLHVAARREELEGADANMACGDPRQHGTRQQGFAHDRLAGRHRRERTRGRDPERRHRLADDVFAEHRPERRAAVAAA